MTNRHIANRYIRALLAREICGWRQVYERSHGFMSRAELHDCVHAAKMFAVRVDLHLARHGDEFMAGDVSPLSDYPGTFAGHS